MKRGMIVGAALAALWGWTACADAGDARRVETARLQGEIDAVSARGGGRVVVTAGEHPCGTLYLKSGVELHLAEGAVLSGGDGPDYYDDAIPTDEVYSYEGCHPYTPTRKAFIYAENATNIAITGTGVIDCHGQGFFNQTSASVWAKPNCMRTRLVVMLRCRDIRLEDATFKDSPVWTMWLRHCENITVSRIRIDADQRMINSDGIDFDACRHVRVGDSSFKTGDDCIVLRAIRHARDAGQDVVCEDVVVSNCVLDSTCQGVRVGCPSDDTVSNAVFRGISFTGNNAISSEQPVRYLETQDGGFFRCRDILFEDWKIDCWGHPVILSVEQGINLRAFGNFTFRDFDVQAAQAFLVAGSSAVRLHDVRFENMRGRVTANPPFEVRNADGVTREMEGGSFTCRTILVGRSGTKRDGIRFRNSPTLAIEELIVGDSLQGGLARAEGTWAEFVETTNVVPRTLVGVGTLGAWLLVTNASLTVRSGENFVVGRDAGATGNVLRVVQGVCAYETVGEKGDFYVGQEAGANANRVEVEAATFRYDRRYMAVGFQGSSNVWSLANGARLEAASAQFWLGARDGAQGNRLVMRDGAAAAVSLFGMQYDAVAEFVGAGNVLTIGGGPDAEETRFTDGCTFVFRPSAAALTTPVLTVNKALGWGARRPVVVDVENVGAGDYRLVASGVALPSLAGVPVTIENRSPGVTARVELSEDGKSLQLKVSSTATVMLVR